MPSRRHFRNRQNGRQPRSSPQPNFHRYNHTERPQFRHNRRPSSSPIEHHETRPRHRRHGFTPSPPSTVSDASAIRQHHGSVHPAVLEAYRAVERSTTHLEEEIATLRSHVEIIRPSSAIMDWQGSNATIYYVPTARHPDLPSVAPSLHPYIDNPTTAIQHLAQNPQSNITGSGNSGTPNMTGAEVPELSVHPYVYNTGSGYYPNTPPTMRTVSQTLNAAHRHHEYPQQQQNFQPQPPRRTQDRAVAANTNTTTHNQVHGQSQPQPQPQPQLQQPQPTSATRFVMCDQSFLRQTTPRPNVNTTNLNSNTNPNGHNTTTSDPMTLSNLMNTNNPTPTTHTSTPRTGAATGTGAGAGALHQQWQYRNNNHSNGIGDEDEDDKIS